MERDKKHQLAQLVALTGFLMVPLGGVAHAYLELGAETGVGLVSLGFLIFLAGAELAFKTKEETQAPDS